MSHHESAGQAPVSGGHRSTVSVHWFDGAENFSVIIRGREAVAFVCCHWPDGTESAVAEVYSSSGNPLDKSSAVANARWIAAAPDMLAVLNAARIVLKNRDQSPQEMKLLDAIKIVIAKAEGRE